jgi:putative mRNA 3-end processing factor
MKYPIDVALSGTVVLGAEVVCDGFLAGTMARVQTHVHEDHMDEFDTSKGYQDILTTQATRQLLVAEQDADLPYRTNIVALPEAFWHRVGGSQVALVSSGHMLGSAQVQVVTAAGMRIGYSGDFGWPLDHPIEVEALVIDSTYGSPDQIRKYSQGESEARFLELATARLKRGPVHVLAYRGTMHRALQLLSGGVACPFIGSSRLCREVIAYREFGYPIRAITAVNSAESTDALASGRYIRLYGKGDKWPIDTGRATRITLSGRSTQLFDPVTEYSDTSYNIALSNHADFAGTLEYVRATKAQFVITDNTRGGKAYELASALKSRLGIQSQPSSDFESREWGGGGASLGGTDE